MLIYVFYQPVRVLERNRADFALVRVVLPDPVTVQLVLLQPRFIIERPLTSITFEQLQSSNLSP